MMLKQLFFCDWILNYFWRPHFVANDNSIKYTFYYSNPVCKAHTEWLDMRKSASAGIIIEECGTNLWWPLPRQKSRYCTSGQPDRAIRKANCGPKHTRASPPHTPPSAAHTTSLHRYRKLKFYAEHLIHPPYITWQ